MARHRLVAVAVFVAAGGALVAQPGNAIGAGWCLFQSEPLTAANVGRVESSLQCLTNLHRVSNGVPALPRDARLGAAARAHSADMVARGYFDHVTPEGAGPSDRARAAGYQGLVGENLAANGDLTALSLFLQWRNGPAHNANMLRGDYEAAGFGVASGLPGVGVGITGTQMFGLSSVRCRYTGLNLYASNGSCARAKLALIKRKRAVRQAKRHRPRKLPAARRKLRRARKAANRVCKPPG